MDIASSMAHGRHPFPLRYANGTPQNRSDNGWRLRWMASTHRFGPQQNESIAAFLICQGGWTVRRVSEIETGPLLEGIGRRIAEIRVRCGWTQAHLAELLGMSTRHLQSVEHGEENLTVDSLVKFAKALQVQVREFFDVPSTPRPGRGRPKKPVAFPTTVTAPLPPKSRPE